MKKFFILILLFISAASYAKAEIFEGDYYGDDEGRWIIWNDQNGVDALVFSEKTQTIFTSDSASVENGQVFIDFGDFEMAGDIDVYSNLTGSWSNRQFSGLFAGHREPVSTYSRFSGIYSGFFSDWTTDKGSFRIEAYSDGSVSCRVSQSGHEYSETGFGAVLGDGQVFASGWDNGYLIRGEITSENFRGHLIMSDGRDYFITDRENEVIIIPDNEYHDSGSDCFIGASTPHASGIVDTSK